MHNYQADTEPGVPDDGGAIQPEPGGAGTESEWADIARRIEQQVRRDVARLVGAGQADDWAGLKEAMLSRAREQASTSGGEIAERIREIGSQVEERVRSGLAGSTGAGQDADWTAIGRALRERVESALDPASARYPGGSGTAASAEDAAVPAAPTTPDQPPRPARAGGEDSGLPTVTQEVDRPPSSP